MQIRWKYLIGINGVLMVLWILHIVTDQMWDRRDLLRIEVRNLLNLAQVLQDTGFEGGRPRANLSQILSSMARIHQGTEWMVLDARSMVHTSSVRGRAGRVWKEPDIEMVLRGEAVRPWKVQDHYHGGQAVLDVTVAVRTPSGKVTHAIHGARRLDLVETMLRQQRKHHFLWALAAIVLIGVVISLVTYRWLIRPVNRMTQLLYQSRWHPGKVGAGDELERLQAFMQQMIQDATEAVESRETLLQQVQSFNEKLESEIENVKQELTRTQAELVRKERLSAVGELAAGLAHELRNPLHIVRGDAELLSRRPENTEACQDILEEVDRIDRFINELLDYTRPLEPGQEQAEVGAAIRSARTAVLRTHKQDSVTIVVQGGDDLRAAMEPDHLRQVLINLMENAVDATAPGGGISVVAKTESRQVLIEIVDQGRGIAPQDLEQIFKPFFTRRPAGTGLGLSIVSRLVELYNGRVEIRSTPGEGTAVMVRLPCSFTRHSEV